MRNIFSIRISLVLPCLFLGLLLWSGCSTSKGSPHVKSRGSDPNLVEPTANQSDNITWSTLLRGAPGVDVRGVEPNLTVRIRGEKSLTQSSEPLYVLDGVRLGRDFSSLAQVALPRDVKSVRVLKGAEAAIYGAEGANGVVVVRMKN